MVNTGHWIPFHQTHLDSRSLSKDLLVKHCFIGKNTFYSHGYIISSLRGDSRTKDTTQTSSRGRPSTKPKKRHCLSGNLFTALMSLYNHVHLYFYTFALLYSCLFKQGALGWQRLKWERTKQTFSALGRKKKSYFNHVLYFVGLFCMAFWNGYGSSWHALGRFGYESICSEVDDACGLRSQLRCLCFPFLLCSAYMGVSSRWI